MVSSAPPRGWFAIAVLGKRASCALSLEFVKVSLFFMGLLTVKKEFLACLDYRGTSGTNTPRSLSLLGFCFLSLTYFLSSLLEHHYFSPGHGQ
jgi:hypothetical protein